MLESLTPHRCAVLSMDFQRDIIADSELAPSDAEALARFDAAVGAASRLLGSARQVGAAVIHVRVAFSSDYREASPHVPMAAYMRSVGALVEGQPGTAFDERVAPRPHELVVTKRAVSAFVGTELDRHLRKQAIDTLILAGLVTHYVVEGTARHASDLGYRVVVMKDACTSAGVDRHEMSLRNLGPLAQLSTVDAVADGWVT